MRKSLVVFVAAVLLLSGCGDDDTAADDAPSERPSSESSPPPTPASSPSTPESAPGSTEPASNICAVITDEQASDWAGTPQTVSPPQDQGTRTLCQTIVDSDDGLGLEWSFQEAGRPFAELVAGEADPGLKRADITLSGGTPAVRLESADFVGAPFVRVVSVIDDKFLVVEAIETPIGEEPITLDTLRTIATNVAEAYASA